MVIVWGLSSGIAFGNEAQKYEWYKRASLMYAIQSKCHKDDPSVSPNPLEIKSFWKSGSLSDVRERYVTDQSAKDEINTKYKEMMGNKLQAAFACKFADAFWTGVKFSITAIEHDIL